MDEIKEPAAALAGELDPGAAIAAEPAAAVPAQSPSAAPHHVFLIDGSGFIFRAYFARARHPADRFAASDGIPTEGVLGFCNMLANARRETDADHIAVVFDASGSRFRNRIYDQYKAHRPEAPPDLVPQFKLVRDATDAFGVCRIELDGFRGRRPDRDLCAPGRRGRRHRHHRLVRQGHDAARQRARDDARPDQETGRSAMPRCARNSASARTRSSRSRRCAATASTMCRACRGSASRPRPS